jgi:hypothetical protein
LNLVTEQTLFFLSFEEFVSLGPLRRYTKVRAVLFFDDALEVPGLVLGLARSAMLHVVVAEGD